MTSEYEIARDNDAQLGRINAFYHEALCGKCIPRAVLFDIEPGVIDAARTSPLGELFRPEKHVSHTRGLILGQCPLHRGWAKIIMTPPLCCSCF
jgi:hypothetical protein